MRRIIGIPDTNMFVTEIILYCLLESQANGIVLDKRMIDLGMDSILEFRDKNFDNDLGIYGFWSQSRNESSNQLFTNSANILGPLNDLERLMMSPVVGMMLKSLNIDLSNVAAFSNVIKNNFKIPSDNDDTCGNLLLGMKLRNSVNTEIYKKWEENNQNIKKTIEIITFNSYQPFSKDVKKNVIDSRSYYFVHEFIQDWISNGRKQDDFVLPFTWFVDFPLGTNPNAFKTIPTTYNSVDLVVVINTFYALSTSLIVHGDSILNQDVERMMRSIIYFFEWGFKSGFVYDRYDVGSVFYPSIYTFSWSISRVVDFLETQSQTLPNHLPSMLNDSLVLLRDIMMNVGTNQILQRMKSDGNGGVYWEDFLGNADTLQGVKKEYGEDRFYSSALALNVLIDTWTITCGDTVNRRWRDNTPQPVKSAVNNGISYIVENIFDNPTQTFNAFFDMGERGPSTQATSYPINYCYDKIGVECKFSPSNPEGVVGAVSGVIPDNQYQEMLKMKWANNTVPTTWSGSFNGSSLVFWSSQPLTYSVSLLALSKSLNIQTLKT
ncbi:hypothetical protein PPL_03979 [Heterostelium album PN500]|uniref:Uncharacterized protein n=1 Tax=Heterostelium pallidum (strain ATCC 26659 / Pp 5 / PN500) TaxID=670386 RepID=D3B5P1_HETP5|nr:hypothetical protein PPL_03979 [Heterostelium album PN500]EFA83189.1 hypothetical protein PPL_03979 [Heterostelium album PN500]|eukprot:XP_020435306.1 hypothetical protein PPL_03979 [Heterostelium album PN500]